MSILYPRGDRREKQEKKELCMREENIRVARSGRRRGSFFPK